MAVNETDPQMASHFFNQAFKSAQTALEHEIGEAAIQLEAAVAVLRFWQASPLPSDETDAQAHVLKFRELWKKGFKTDIVDENATKDQSREDDSVTPDFNNLTLEEEPLGSIIPGLTNLALTTGPRLSQQQLLSARPSDREQHPIHPGLPIISHNQLERTLPAITDAITMQDLQHQRAVKRRAKKAKKVKVKVPKAKARKQRNSGIGYLADGGADDRVMTEADNQPHRKIAFHAEGRVNDRMNTGQGFERLSTQHETDSGGRIITGANNEALGVREQAFLGEEDDAIT